MAVTLSPEIMAGFDALPPLSDSVASLLPVVNKETHTAQDVVRVIERDPVLTAKILKVANSAAYARRVPAETAAAAVTYLGDMTIVGLALRLGNAAAYEAPLVGYNAVRGALWEHSLKTAIAARLLAAQAKTYLSPSIAYTAGLMHDIGKVVLSAFIKGAAEVGVDYLDFERRSTNTDHAEVGALLAHRWRLSAAIEAAIGQHHLPQRASLENRPLVYCVHVADFVAMLGGAGTGGDSLAYHLDEGYAEYFNVTRKELFKVIWQMDLEFEKINEALRGA